MPKQMIITNRAAEFSTQYAKLLISELVNWRLCDATVRDMLTKRLEERQNVWDN